MGVKNTNLRNAIERFVCDYADSNSVSPTMQEIADGVGSSKATVYRYIANMSEDGILEYS